MVWRTGDGVKTMGSIIRFQSHAWNGLPFCGASITDSVDHSDGLLRAKARPNY